MKIVYTKGHLINGCPTCDNPIFNEELIFEDMDDHKAFLLKIYQERYLYVYSNIYALNGDIVINIIPSYGLHTIKDIYFYTVFGNYRVEEDGKCVRIVDAI